jgi:hypothetical protein
MLFSNACRFVFFSVLSLSVNAKNVRGTQRKLTEDPVELGTAGNYVILTKTGVSSVPASDITGDMAVSPAAATYLTGFGLTADSTNQFSTSTQITGKAFAANYATPIPTHLTTAVSNMEAAYTAAAGRDAGVGDHLNYGSGALGGVFGGVGNELTPGVYTFGTGVTIGADIYFDGSDTDVFIMQMTGDLLQAANTEVHLTGGALAKNIFWQVAGYVEVGDEAHMEGIILSKTSVLFKTGSSLDGRVLTQTACNLQSATITQP